MTTTKTLPFTCPNCSTAVVSNLPFTNAPTSCCGTPITGRLTREPSGHVHMTITSWVMPGLSVATDDEPAGCTAIACPMTSDGSCARGQDCEVGF